MKTKLIISAFVIILTAGFYSFKSGEKESSTTALVSLVTGKNEGFLILYGDGTTELKPWEIKYTSPETMMKAQAQLALVMHQLNVKGYRYVGMSTLATNSMAFEKK